MEKLYLYNGILIFNDNVINIQCRFQHVILFYKYVM